MNIFFSKIMSITEPPANTLHDVKNAMQTLSQFKNGNKYANAFTSQVASCMNEMTNTTRYLNQVNFKKIYFHIHSRLSRTSQLR